MLSHLISLGMTSFLITSGSVAVRSVGMPAMLGNMTPGAKGAGGTGGLRAPPRPNGGRAPPRPLPLQSPGPPLFPHLGSLLSGRRFLLPLKFLPPLKPLGSSSCLSSQFQGASSLTGVRNWSGFSSLYSPQPTWGLGASLEESSGTSSVLKSQDSKPDKCGTIGLHLCNDLKI